MVTFIHRPPAYGAASNTNAMDSIMKKVESEPHIISEWKFYSVAANAYSKVGLVDKAIKMLKKIEELTKTGNFLDRTAAYDFLLRLYGKIGWKDDLYRIWNRYKMNKILNRSYLAMISSVLMFDDIKGAKKILDEWEARGGLLYDFNIPNCLIDAYLKDGRLKEAEALVSRGIEKGGKPNFQTWRALASGYIEDNRVGEAIDALKKAFPLCPPHLDPIKDILSTCLEYLEGQADAEEMEKFIRLLKEKEIFSATVLGKLCSFI